MPIYSLPRVCGVLLALCITVGLATAPVAAQPTPNGAVPVDSVQTQRLASLAQLYGVAAFYHPDLGAGTMAWDSAFAAAAEQIATTTDADAYAQAVRDLLGALDDPVTRLRSTSPPQAPPPSMGGDAPDAVRWAADSVLVATMNPSTIRSRSDVVQFQRTLQQQLPQAQGVVMDVRNAGFIPVGRFLDSQRDLMARLAPEPYALPLVQTRMHEGFAPEGGGTSGGYASYTRTREGAAIQPAAATNTGPVVLLASAGGTIPRFALALQQAGRGVVIQEGTDEPVYASVPTHTVSLAGGLTAEVRLGRLVTADGTQPAPAAITVDASDDTTDAALDRALTLARGDAPLPAVPPAAASRGPGASAEYTDEAYPPAGERMLAVARGWSIIEHFFPYKDLMDAPWREALPAAIEGALAAEGAEAYHLAIGRLMVQTNDSHVAARSDVLSRLRGETPAPVLVRSIEGQPVVTDIVDDAVADTSGLRRGDVILSVDGTPAAARMDSLARFYRAASTPQARQHHAAFRLLWGDAGSTATVRVRGADGTERTVELPRGRYNLGRDDTPVMRRLTDRIGYADLDRLERAQVDSMFTRFADTDAIIFDMRGYPNGTAWAIAPRLAETEQPVAASFAKPLRLGPGERDRQTFDFDQRVPPRRGARYTGKTVMLIDERAISQAEHTGLFLKAANGTTFVGSPTNGANGDVTRFRLPGGIRVDFTGQSVRHPDGTQLQRRGLQPDVEARPTIESIRRAEDAVLQTALEYLQRELGPTEP
ncbi:MAG: hypothetical protein GVY35_08170 [Bacteroidetes bacterium]|jgi:C-terminal processing protease CtpA/Prc|nr:hypothetical protein [Bacteroidota bacterium]